MDLSALDVNTPLTPQPKPVRRKIPQPPFSSNKVVKCKRKQVKPKLSVSPISVYVPPEYMGPCIFNFDKNNIGNEKTLINVSDLQDVGIPGDYSVIPFMSETAHVIDRMLAMSKTIVGYSGNISGSFVVPHTQNVSLLLNIAMLSTMPSGLQQLQGKKSMVLTVNSTMKSRNLDIIKSSGVVGNDSKSSDVSPEEGYAEFHR
jgi:hypothetical protein